MNTKIPAYGSIPRPTSPEEALNELTNNCLDWTGGKIAITYETEEFTSLCPSTGQPDFSEIKIGYIPSTRYIESKSLKFYLWIYRDMGMHCEHIADKIATDIKTATDAKSVYVCVKQSARGGLQLTSEVTK